MAQRIVDHTTSIQDLQEQDSKQKETAKKAEQAQQSENNEETTSSKPSKGSKKVRSANYKKAREAVHKKANLSTEEAIKDIRKAAYAKFTESVELHVKLGIDKTKSDQRIRFTTSLPNGIGKKIKVLVIGTDNSGEKDGVIYRDASAIDEIVKGDLKPDTDFNIIVAHPSAMKDIAKAAKILGPKGLMPSPKNGTVTDNPKAAIEELAKGQVEIRTQGGHAVIHQIVGNLDFKDEELVENINHLLSELNKNAPAKVKKKFIQNVYVTSTMGPSVKIAA